MTTITHTAFITENPLCDSIAAGVPQQRLDITNEPTLPPGTSALSVEIEDSSDEDTIDWTDPLDIYSFDHPIHAHIDDTVHLCQTGVLDRIKHEIQTGDFQRELTKLDGTAYPSISDNEKFGISQLLEAKYSFLIRKEMGKQVKKRARDNRLLLRDLFAARPETFTTGPTSQAAAPPS